MTMDPELSVVIPCCNEEAVLGECCEPGRSRADSTIQMGPTWVVEGPHPRAAEGNCAKDT